MEAERPREKNGQPCIIDVVLKYMRFSALVLANPFADRIVSEEKTLSMSLGRLDGGHWSPLPIT